MTNFVPIFPLALVVYPGEKLNLHIFEPRYKQLIRFCIEQQKPFGIPTVLDGKPGDCGCLVEITAVAKEYEDGRMDIHTKGLKVFKMLEVIKEIPDKLYSGAIVAYINNFENGSAQLMKKIIADTRALHQSLNEKKDFGKPDELLTSFDLAHHTGMNLEDEYQLLQYENELHRQEFIKRHLAKTLVVMQQMQELKKKIQLNGHFKEMNGWDI
jgi:Lon protease-like protein